jgi:hypothetical protein
MHRELLHTLAMQSYMVRRLCDQRYEIEYTCIGTIILARLGKRLD